MRILVTGDRNWRNAAVVYNVLGGFGNSADDLTLVHGDARGADTVADICWQLLFDREPERYPALWDLHGRSAGPIRNKQMLDTGIDFVVGFHNDILSSRGTRDMLERCLKAGIPGRLFTETEEVPNWPLLLR